MSKIELHKYTIAFRNEIENVTAVTLLLVDNVQAIEVATEMLKINDIYKSVSIIDGYGEIVKTIYKKTMCSLLEYMSGMPGSLESAVEQIRKMSDKELLEITCMIRKLLRHCDYDSRCRKIVLSSEYVTDLIDKDSLVLFSKLLMAHPYSSSEEVAERISIIDGKKGGIQ